MLAMLIVVALPLASALPTNIISRRGTMVEPEAMIVKHMESACSRVNNETPTWDCGATFVVSDPNAQNLAAVCKATWEWDGVTNKYNTEYVNCMKNGQELIEFTIDRLDSPASMSIGTGSRHKNSKMAAPYDYPMTFSQGDVALTDVVEDSDTRKAYSSGDKEFKLDFYGMSN